MPKDRFSCYFVIVILNTVCIKKGGLGDFVQINDRTK